jgi:outer membrane protein assembly factor BamB
VATTGGNLFALNKDTGAIKWAVGGTGSYHYNGVSVANGVVYDINDEGALEAFDASNGRPLLVHPLLTESGGPYQDGENSSGVSVARDTVYVASAKPTGGGSALFAFKLGAGSGTGPPLPSPPPLPKLGRGLTVLAGPGSYNTTYWTPFVIVQAGNEKLSFTNLDLQRHNVVEVTTGTPLFDSALAGLGQTVPVNFHGHLERGKVYSFYCTIHPGMFGRILAV